MQLIQKISAQLLKLTAKFQKPLNVKNKWTWGPQESEVFLEIKEKFLQTVLLHHLDFNKPFFLNCDKWH